MKKKVLYLVFIFSQTCVIAQQLPNESSEDRMEAISSALDRSTKLIDCGHFLDTPASFVKEMENRSLDAMLPFTDMDKEKLGQEISKHVLKSNKVANDHPAIMETIDLVNRLVTAIDPENRRDFELIFLDSKDVSAFITLGGYIYLTTGLLDFVDSYDELAFIVGHEVGHEVELHTQRKITKLMVSSNLINRANLEEYRDLAIGINTQFSAPFSQIDEYEADEYGFFLAKKAGYDVNHFDDFFEKIEKDETKSILNKMTSTHPFAADRKNCIKEYISH